MKKMLGWVLLCGLSLGTVGCNGVGYTAHERHQQIARNWDLEGRMLTDDFDSFFLLRPVSQLSLWHVRP
jgi:hypothetical protein